MWKLGLRPRNTFSWEYINWIFFAVYALQMLLFYYSLQLNLCDCSLLSCCGIFSFEAARTGEWGKELGPLLFYCLTLSVAGVLSRLARETECPVCLSEMRGRVWQCVSGHILCEICHDRPEVQVPDLRVLMYCTVYWRRQCTWIIDNDLLPS